MKCEMKIRICPNPQYICVDAGSGYSLYFRNYDGLHIIGHEGDAVQFTTFNKQTSKLLRKLSKLHLTIKDMCEN